MSIRPGARDLGYRTPELGPWPPGLGPRNPTLPHFVFAARRAIPGEFCDFTTYWNSPLPPSPLEFPGALHLPPPPPPYIPKSAARFWRLTFGPVAHGADAARRLKVSREHMATDVRTCGPCGERREMTESQSQ